jgi:hypothetical protein
MVYRLPGQHVIAVHLILDIPLSVEDRAHEGVATISARTLDEGTRTHPGEEFAELLEPEGAGFGIDASLAGLQAFLDVPASRLDRALQLFAEASRRARSGGSRTYAARGRCGWLRSSRREPTRPTWPASRSGLPSRPGLPCCSE